MPYESIGCSYYTCIYSRSGNQSEHIGALLGDQTVCVLLYMYDIIHLANCVDSLQSLLDEVHLWC